jgi:hypothetical protein
MRRFNIGYDVKINQWDDVDAETEEEAIAILKARVSDDRGIPEANIDVHVIYDDGESNGNS